MSIKFEEYKSYQEDIHAKHNRYLDYELKNIENLVSKTSNETADKFDVFSHNFTD